MIRGLALDTFALQYGNDYSAFESFEQPQAKGDTMAVCRAPGRSRGRRDDDFGAIHQSPLTDGAFAMTTKYVVVRTKTPQPGGGFIEAFELGMADLNAWGDQYYDASGYPYPDEVHAFVHDWLNLGTDFEAAMRKVNDLAREQNAKIAGNDNGERPQEGKPAPGAPEK